MEFNFLANFAFKGSFLCIFSFNFFSISGFIINSLIKIAETGYPGSPITGLSFIKSSFNPKLLVVCINN